MTNQLEALIADMKAAAESATGGQWVLESGEGWNAICSVDDQLNSGFMIAEFQGPEAQANRLFSQSANPENVLALIAALEQAKKRIAELEASHLPSVPALYLCRVFRNGEELYSPCGKDYPRGRAYYTRASQLVVKLPNRLQPGADGPDDWYLHSDPDGEYMKADDVVEAIRAAGGTVQGDE